MNKEEVFAKLCEIIEDICGRKDMKLETALVKEGILDSLEIINYLTQIEDTYEISISLDMLSEKQLGIIDNMVNFIIENK